MNLQSYKKHYLINRSTGSYFEPPDYDYHPACGAINWRDGVYYDHIVLVNCKNCMRTLDFKHDMKHRYQYVVDKEVMVKVRTSDQPTKIINC